MDSKKTDPTIGQHVKKLMKYSKRDLAVMYANLHWCYEQITSRLRVKPKKTKNGKDR